MALLASRRKSSRYVIRIGSVLEVLGMAGITLRRKSLELPGRRSFMARLAVNGGVRSDKRKAVLVIANCRNGNMPSSNRVARLTICPKLASVNIRMAIGAFLAHIRKD